MKIIIWKKWSGKTTELIKIAAMTWQYILCADRYRVDNIKRLAKKMDLEISNPITLKEINSVVWKSGRWILIDDLEEILNSILWYFSVDTVAINSEEWGIVLKNRL